MKQPFEKHQLLTNSKQTVNKNSSGYFLKKINSENPEEFIVSQGTFRYTFITFMDFFKGGLIYD